MENPTPIEFTNLTVTLQSLPALTGSFKTHGIAGLRDIHQDSDCNNDYSYFKSFLPVVY